MVKTSDGIWEHAEHRRAFQAGSKTGWVSDVEHQLELSWNGIDTESAQEEGDVLAALLPLEDTVSPRVEPVEPRNNGVHEAPAEPLSVDLSTLAIPADPLSQPSESQRTRQLEQALYQCQLYIEELKHKLVDQAFLEEQLAATEAFSHVQKQAIETLKTQVMDQQAVSSEIEALKQQLAVAQKDQKAAETIAEQYETEVSMLKLKVLQGQSELQRIRDKNDQMAAQLEALQSSMVQETQQRIIAQKTADRLRNDLRNREAVLQESARRIKQTEEMLSHREKIIGALKDKHQPESQKNQFIQELSATLLQAQKQIATLEEDNANHMIVQAQLQHTIQEFEQEAHRSQVRSDAVDHQVAELQEQVLRQAQQASEYETAIQHWKNRTSEAEEWASEVAKAWAAMASERDTVTDATLTKTLDALQRWLDTAQRKTSSASQDMTPHELLGLRPRPPGFYGY
jgi:chromosome segregation ATPase